MNDAERDAWLREALRHAPDSDALPPSGVSEAILLKARAAARARGAGRRDVPRRATRTRIRCRRSGTGWRGRRWPPASPA